MLFISLVSSINANEVDLLDLNLYWLSLSDLCFSMKLLSWAAKSFSIILENCDSSETSL